MTFSDLELPLAHVGHWLANLLYLLPVAILAGGILWQRWHDRSEAGEKARIPEEDVPFTDQ